MGHPNSVALLLDRGGAGAAYCEEFGDAVGGGGERRKGCVRLGLVPVGYGVETVGAVVGVAVLDGDLD